MLKQACGHSVRIGDKAVVDLFYQDIHGSGDTVVACLDADRIENYILRHLDEAEIAVVEERLLICERCREIYSRVETNVCEIRRVLGITQKPANKGRLKTGQRGS